MNTNTSGGGNLPASDGSKPNDIIATLQDELQAFARERDWEQFHAPKNLSMALIAECAEVVEHFQWLEGAESQNLSDETRQRVGHELADVFIYTLRLASVLDINLIDATREKMRINTHRYPAERVRGDARRAADYGPDTDAESDDHQSP